MSSFNLFRSGRRSPRCLFSGAARAGLLAGIVSFSIATSQARPSPLLYSFKPATRLTYELVHDTGSASDFGEAVPKSTAAAPALVTSPLTHSFRTSLKTQMSLTVLREAPEGFLVCYSLSEPELALTAFTEVDPAKLAIIRRELTANTFAIISPQGRILSLWLDPSLHELSRNFIKAALAITQFVLPTGDVSSPSDWNAEEDDPNGSYIARYQAVAKKGEPIKTSFCKSKLRYLVSGSAKLSNGVYEVMPSVTSDAHYTGWFDLAGGRLDSLEGSETQTFTVAEHEVGRSKITLSFRLVKSETIDLTQLQTLRLASAERQTNRGEKLAARQSSQTTELAFQRKYLGDATLASLLSALDKCDSPGGESETQLYLKVRALIYLQPETAQALGRLLQTSDPASKKAAVLLSALGAVGSNEAQAALVATMRARTEDEPLREKILFALSECDVPTPATEEALRVWASSHR